MNSRENQNEQVVQSQNDQTQGPSQATKNGVLVLIAPPIIAGGLFPLELAMQFKVSGTGRLGPSAFGNFFLANYKILCGTVFPRTLGQSGIKNGILSSKDYVQGKVDTFSNQEGYEAPSTSPVEAPPPSLKQRVGASAATAGILLPPELFFTQPFATQRNLNSLYIIKNSARMKANLPLLELPYLPYMSQKFDFWKTGIGARGVGIGSNAFSFVFGQNVLKGEFQKIFPSEQYPYLGTGLAMGITGFTSGVINHGTYLIFQNTLDKTRFEKSIDLPWSVIRESYKKNHKPIEFDVKITAPNFLRASKEFFKTNGIRGLKTGSGYSVVMTCGAYSLYNVAEYCSEPVAKFLTDSIASLKQKVSQYKETSGYAKMNSSKGMQNFGLFNLNKPQTTKSDQPEQKPPRP